MNLFETEAPPPSAPRAAAPAPSLPDVDFALAAQLTVAWAGEAGEDRRLGWWRSDLVSEFGGEDLFRRLLPNTFPWAILQGAREAARRRDAELRRQSDDPDRIVTLFALGFDLDERLDERLQALKRAGAPPHTALPGLADVSAITPWRPDTFRAWVASHGSADLTPSSLGRLLKGPPPSGLRPLVSALVAALAPVPDAYPLPHFRRPA